ncbi:MAG: DegT/DnrJ/EryC1/StrS family aminotransferase, partial [Planctomycetia bacterium]|nr:DegT/DnrJ/EryC1/StrS family aminotransferase [Planctomycetia bacterium]
HLYGQLADMKALRRMTKDHSDPQRQKIVLIEDAAQAIGAELDSIPAGGWGDMACLSFYPTKNLGGAGDGGMIITNNEEYARQVRLLRGHGMEPRYYHKVIGINSRLDSWQAAILNVKLPHLESWVHMRQRNAQNYQDMFEERGLDRVIGLPAALSDRYHVWNQYVVRIPGGRRDGLRTALNEKKIGTDIYYPMGLHQQECFAYLGYKPEELPETYRASQEVLALPIFPELRPEEQWAVVCAIGDYLTGQGVCKNG